MNYGQQGKMRSLYKCSYKDKNFRQILLTRYKDFQGKNYIKVVCNGAHMWDYKTVKEAFQYIKRANPLEKTIDFFDWSRF